jgi:hypothetical protein
MYLQTKCSHVLYIIYSTAWQLYLITRNRALLEKLPVSQIVTPTLYVTLRINAQEAAGGLEDTFVCSDNKPQFICRIVSKFHLCVQNTTNGSVNMALEQNHQDVWRVTCS